MHLPRKLDKPDLLPGTCSRCLAGQNREFYMDLGFQTWDEPGVYLCNECIVDLIKEDGRFMLISEHEKQKEQWNGMIEKAVTANEKYLTLVDHLKEVISGSERSSRDASDASESDVVEHSGEFDSSNFALKFS